MIRSLHIDTADAWRGSQNQVLLLVTGLEASGHPAVLVAHELGELRRRAREGLRFLGFAPRSEFDAHAAWQLGRFLADVRPDVVHAHDAMGVALAAMAMREGADGAARTPLVATRRVDLHLRRQAFSKWKHARVDVFIAASAMIASILERDGVRPDQIEIVRDGVDVGLIDKQPAVDAHGTFWLPHGSPLVGNVSALTARKGQRHLVAAAARVVREIPDARFLIVGEGEERPALERQIRELGLERHVVLTGFRTDAIGIMKALDIFVMSSVTEGLGSIVLEPMACSRAVVATRAGGLPEVVADGETGLLVPPGDEAAMAAAIVRLLQDPDLRARLGNAGRNRAVDHFSVERMVAATVEVYKRRLARATTPPGQT